MRNPFTSFFSFVSYWYFRYLMVTELYMVEKWERVFCNITILLILTLLSFLNCKMLSFSSTLLSEGFGNFSLIT